MKKVSPPLFTCILSFCLLHFAPQARACNLSDVSLLSITAGPSTNTTIAFRACIGYGITGSTKGADGGSTHLSFGWYTTTTVPAFDIVSYTPTSLVSNTTFNSGTNVTCTMVGQTINGPLGPMAPAKKGTFYVFPGTGPCPKGFLCITSTADCSEAGQLCWNFSFVVNYVPDSMRFFAAEGAGNQSAGCYPHADMKIDFTTLPVLWGDVAARTVQNTVNVSWSTLQETNTDMFFVERLNPSGAFEAIATLPASDNTHKVTHYTFTDLSPQVGANTYRLVEVSKSGEADASASAEAMFQASGDFSWGAIGPVPTRSYVKLNFFSGDAESDVSMQVVDVGGKVVIAKSIDAVLGTNTMDLDLSGENAGIYFVNLKGKTKSLYYKLVKE